jgi:hypothetical protein
LRGEGEGGGGADAGGGAGDDDGFVLEWWHGREFNHECMRVRSMPGRF